MNIMNIIEQYVEISVRKHMLEKTVESAQQDINYAKLQGDTAYYEGNFKKEAGYNESVRSSKLRKQNAENELSQTRHLLEHTHQLYIETIQMMSYTELKETALKVKLKVEELENKIEELEDRRNWAIQKGDIAYSQGDFQAEREYNTISSECYMEIHKIRPAVMFYKSFITNLNYQADLKKSQGISSTKHKK